MGVARRQTVAFAENRNFIEQRYFPASMASEPLCQIQADSWKLRLTGYRGLVRFGGLILIEKFLEVNQLASLFLLRPRSMTPLHLDLHAHLGSRRNTSTCALDSDSVRGEEIRDIRALGWCPGPVVFPP